MTGLRWVSCPKCGENADLQRLGPALSIGTKRKRGAAPNQKATVLTTSIETRVKCGYCGTIFNTTEPTMREAMGWDGAGDTSF